MLPVTDLGFNMLTNPLTQVKDFFMAVQPTNWSIGTAPGSNLIYVGQQGSESFEDQSHGNVYGVYSNPGFSVTVPAGTNFYQADGNPAFESTIFQTIPNLTAATYTLQFQQAAGQQGFPNTARQRAMESVSWRRRDRATVGLIPAPLPEPTII